MFEYDLKVKTGKDFTLFIYVDESYPYYNEKLREVNEKEKNKFNSRIHSGKLVTGMIILGYDPDKYEIHLYSYYIYKDIPEEAPLLRGLGFKSLCYILDELVYRFPDVDMNIPVRLEAGGGVCIGAAYENPLEPELYQELLEIGDEKDMIKFLLDHVRETYGRWLYDYIIYNIDSLRIKEYKEKIKEPLGFEELSVENESRVIDILYKAHNDGMLHTLVDRADLVVLFSSHGYIGLLEWLDKFIDVSPGIVNAQDIDTLEYFLSKGVDPNTKDPIGSTALHGTNDPEMIRLLLSYGADPRIKNDEFGTPLEEKKWYVKYFLENGDKKRALVYMEAIRLLEEAMDKK